MMPRSCSQAFWKGAIMGAIPCILTKVCCAPFMGDAPRLH